MTCCGGKDEDHKQEGMVEDRKCRDVLFLLLFVAYWAGMFVVCGIAFDQGDAQRLVYGLDSRGMLCGASNTYRNTTVDLTARSNLYYLNALDLLDVSNIMYAKTVCVDSCPTVAQMCNTSSLPCIDSTQYVCPYYRFAEDSLYSQLDSSLSLAETSYWNSLPNATISSCNSSFLDVLATKVNLTSFGINASSYCSSASIDGRYYQLTSQFPAQGPCYPIWTPTVPYFNRCFPNFPPAFTDQVFSMVNASEGVLSSAVTTAKSQWNSAGNQFSAYVADISKGILIIVVGGLVAGIVLSLFWMFILRYFAGVMAWFTIIAVNLLLIGCTLYCFKYSGQLSAAGALGAQISDYLPLDMDPSADSRVYWSYIAYAMCAVVGLVLLFTLVMLRRVAVAVACIKVASQAVAVMPSIMFFPLLPFIFEVGLIIYWVAVTAVLYSAGEPTPHWRPENTYKPLSVEQLLLPNQTAPVTQTAPVNMTGWSTQDTLDYCADSPDCYISYDWNDKLMYAFIYHLFGLLWTNQFIVGFACVVVSGAVASFYWEQGDRSRMPTFPVIKAMRNTVIYHLGSVAFGAFIIALIQMIRILLEYVDKKTRNLQQANKVAEWAMCCVKCCMWCLEKIVAFINRNAFILVAVKGSNYCVSAARAVQLIVSNALRLAAVNVIGDALLFLAKLGVAAGCGLVAFGMSNTQYYNDPEAYPSTYLSSAILPIAVAVLTGYIVGNIFFSVYEMAIDTVLLSFCEDCESNGGHPRCAPALLMEAIGEKFGGTAQAADPYAVVVRSRR